MSKLDVAVSDITWNSTDAPTLFTRAEAEKQKLNRYTLNKDEHAFVVILGRIVSMSAPTQADRSGSVSLRGILEAFFRTAEHDPDRGVGDKWRIAFEDAFTVILAWYSNPDTPLRTPKT